MKRLIPIIAIQILVSGCKVGPDYHRPCPVMPIDYTEDRPDQTFQPEDSDLVLWWTRFNDPFLNGLLEETIEGSFDYRIAIEKIWQARAQYWVQFASIFPDLESDGTATRFRASESFASRQPIPGAPTLSPIQDFFQVGFDAVWEIDLFGRLRRSADAAYDTMEATAEEARDVKISVLSEVARTYAIICATQKKIEIATDIVQSDEHMLNLLSVLFQSGLSNEQDVEAARGTLHVDSASKNALEIILRQNIYSLGILLGRPPETIVEEFNIMRPIPPASGKIPAGIPGDLLRRRHDIRAAERQLASATEEIGVAVAELYPKVSITGSSSSFAVNPLQGANIGYSSDTASKLFSPQSRIWGYGAFISWPIYDFGKRQAGIDLQVSLRNQAYLTFQKTVTKALQEVEQALAAYFNEEARLKNLSIAAEANLKSFRLNTDLFNAGLTNYTEVLLAKDRWLSSVNSLTDSQQALTIDLIAVYKALGGDW